MTREEFLRTLGEKLAGLPAEERDDAIKYYSEYLDEAGTDNEAAAIEELGDITRVANVIIANSPTYQNGQYQALKKQKAKPELTLDGPDWKHKKAADEAPKAEKADTTYHQAGSGEGTANGTESGAANGAQYNTSGAQAPKYAGYQYGGAQPVNSASGKNTGKLIVFIILAVIFIPPLVSALFGLIIGLFSLIFGIAAACVALVVSAVICVFASIGVFTWSLASGLATLGLGLCCAAVGVIIGRAVIMLGLRFVPRIINFIKRMFIKIKAWVVNNI